jgi:hypothetical protein
MSFYSDQAAQFEQTAQTIQDRLSNEGATLDDATYGSLEAQRDALLDKANTMILADVQAQLAQLKIDQTRLAKCTKDLNDAVKNVKRLDQVLAIVSAAVTLATALASADPGKILDAIGSGEKAVAAAFAKPAANGVAGGLSIAASGDSSKSKS